MKILNWYVAKSFLATFFMAIAVLTFGMTGNNLIKVFDYVSEGVPLSSAMLFVLYAVPMALAFTIPWASLVSIMLVFGRMSADNEITAMRACGISILQIVSPIIVMTFGMTCLCLYLQMQIGPYYISQARELIKGVASRQPLALFTPGVAMEFNNLRILIDSKEGDNKIKNIQLFVLDDQGNWTQDVNASSGTILTYPEVQRLDIVLHNATVASREGSGDYDRLIRSYSETLTVPIEYGKQFNEKNVSRRDKYLTYKQLYARYILDVRSGEDTTMIEVELNQRVALSLAPIAFLLLGLPLAIRTSRRETSIGLFISVLLAGLYYGGVLTSDAIRKHQEFFPQYIVWIPPLLFQVFGAIYIVSIARK